LSILLSFADVLPCECTGTVVELFDRAVALKKDDEEVVWLRSKSYAPSLCCFHLDEGAVLRRGVVALVAAGQEGKAVIVAGEYFAEAAHEVSVKREGSSKRLLEFSNEVVQASHDAGELLDRAL
jgi:hypothetical protein